jgi:hypothetical protein
MSAVLIANPLPAQIVALSEEAAANLAGLIRQGEALTTVANADDYAAADHVLAQVVKALKDIEAERKRIKAPIIDLGRALDEAAGEALAPLAGLKVELGKKLLAYQTAENARRAEEARKVAEARAAAEAKARAEQQEADRIRKEAEAARLSAEMAVEVAAERGETLPPWEMLDAPAEVPAPVVIVPEYIAPAAPLLKSSAVTTKTVKRLEVYDESQIPAEAAGVRLWIRDDKAIEKLLKAGVAVPGCRLVESTIIAAK